MLTAERAVPSFRIYQKAIVELFCCLLYWAFFKNGHGFESPLYEALYSLLPHVPYVSLKSTQGLYKDPQKLKTPFPV